MKPLFRNLMPGLAVALLLAACGGGGGDDDAASTVPPPTVSIAASPTAIEAGQSVNLTATAAPGNGGTLSYAWNLQAPDGSSAVIATPASKDTSLATDLPGEYKVQLQVKEGNQSATSEVVTITATNPNPLAVVVPDVSGEPGQTIQLDGSKSLPPDGQSASGLTYAWTLSVPTGSTAVLDDPTSATPRFVADQLGSYTATLTVKYGDKTSKPATVTVTITQANRLPVANAGAAQTVARGQTVNLDGSGSTDEDGDALQYRWTFTSSPTGSKTTITDYDKAKASFVPDAVGTYSAQLYVYDGKARSKSGSTVKITVTLPEGAVNQPPVATFPGNDGTAGVNSGLLPGSAVEYELGVRVWLAALQAGYDLDGNYAQAQTKWELISYPADFNPSTFTSYSTGSAMFYTTTTPGDYVVKLTVYDTEGASDSVTQTIRARNGANTRPFPIAKNSTGAASVKVGSTVTLDASDSYDLNDDEMRFAWELIDRPDGSTAVLGKADTNNPTFVADQPGPYIARVTATDIVDGRPNSTSYSQVMVIAKTNNNPPVIRPEVGYVGGNLAVGSKASVSIALNGYDPDGDTINYIWVLESAPDKSKVNWTNIHCDGGWGLKVQPSTYDAENHIWNCTSGGGGVSLLAADYAASTTSNLQNDAAAVPSGTYRFLVSASDGIDTTDAVTVEIKLIDAGSDCTAKVLLEGGTCSEQDKVGYSPNP